jgi:hypothetical protein
MTHITKNLNKQRMTLFIKNNLIKQAKAQAIVDDTTLTQLIEKALIQYLPTETIIRKAEV